MDRFYYQISMIRTLSDQYAYKKYNINPIERMHTEIRAEVNRIADSIPNDFYFIYLVRIPVAPGAQLSPL